MSQPDEYQQFVDIAIFIISDNTLSFCLLMIMIKSNHHLQVGPTSVQITTPERHRVLGYSSILNDVYYASEVKGVRLFNILECKSGFQLSFAFALLRSVIG